MAKKNAAAAQAVEAEVPAEAVVPSRKTEVLDLFNGGMARGDIAQQLGISYAAVYHHTKGLDGPSGRRGVILDDPENPGQTISRADAMRRDFEGGMTVSEITKKYDVIYQVAWQATKGKAQRDAEAAEGVGEGEETEA